MSVSISHAVRHTRTKAANAPRSMPGATTVPQQRLYVSGQGTGCMAPSKTSLVVAGNGTGRRASTFGAVSGCMLVLPLVPECQAPGFIDEPV